MEPYRDENIYEFDPYNERQFFNPFWFWWFPFPPRPPFFPGPRPPFHPGPRPPMPPHPPRPRPRNEDTVF